MFNWPEFGDRLVMGKFCAIASGTQFIMGPANHRLSSVTTYPFHVFGGVWAERTPPHLSQLPHKGDIVLGNDVWIGRECTILPGTQIGDGSIVAACSVVSGAFAPYSVIGGNPARLIKKRFDDALIAFCSSGGGGICRRKNWRRPSHFCATGFGKGNGGDREAAAGTGKIGLRKKRLPGRCRL